jgi:hypothetical protein
MVLATDRAMLCCVVYDEGFNVGSVRDSSFEKLLNNDKMWYIRHNIRLDMRKRIDYCRNCAQSIGGKYDDRFLSDSWKTRIWSGEIADEEDLTYLEQSICRRDTTPRFDAQ